MSKRVGKTIDTEVRHVTPAGANLFAHLGFPAEEAERLKQDSEEEINHALALKEQLIGELESWITTSGLEHSEAAERLHITAPRLSDVVNKQSAKFTIDALLAMLARAGKQVTITVSA